MNKALERYLVVVLMHQEDIELVIEKVRTHFRPIETFQSTHLNSCNPVEVERFRQRRISLAS